MNGNRDIFKDFCRYVDEHIFSKENMGSYVAFIVDQAFIDDFSRENRTNEEELMCSLRVHMWGCNHKDHLFSKGMAAIQLYATTKRADSDGLTTKAYRGRLSQVIGVDIKSIQKWMSIYQDAIWHTIYIWCDKNSFKITKTQRRSRSYCYVQYPLAQALKVFTDEDLLYIAKCFVDYNLYPGEDIIERDFWKIIPKYSLERYFGTNHAFEVKNNSVSHDDYLTQIYNFFLRWNGRYKHRENISRTNTALLDLCAYLTSDLQHLEFRDENLNRKGSRINLDIAKYGDVSKLYPFKRHGMLLFKKDDIYDDLWQEVRYIEAGEDEYTEESGEYALLLEFKNEPDTNGLINPIRRFPVIKETKNIVIYKITRRLSTIEFFAKKRNYELYGGLKIGRNSYLRNAVPILRLLSPTMVWIDGSPLGEGVVGDVPLNHLGIGAHFIKVPNARKMKLRVVDATALMRFWADDFNKWVISKKQNKWHSEKQDIGVVGLDFPSYTNDEEELRGNITQRWSEKLAFGTEQQSESNIAIKILTDR